MPNDWRCDTVVFGYDQVPARHMTVVTNTGEETLGGKRNAAVKCARANNYDLIAFLDGDDLFGPSWIPGLCAEYDRDRYSEMSEDRIYHPQWSILFDPTKYVIREHIGQIDPRFDSRDMMFYNPWSALCAFNPLSAKWKYREHKKTDKKFSFEDWSFNLDTWCDGQVHVVVPDTYHFLRMRMNSLGKSTIHNT
ncbi:MAG: glycosyltransferase, partial [Pseudomonadota bacterium]